MQDCSKYNTMLSAYLDGELHGKEAKELEKHLRTCEECQKYLALLKSVKEGLKEELPPAPETLRQGIAYKLELEKKRQKLYFGAFGRWTAIAAVLCLVVFGVVRLTGSGVSRTSQAVPAAGGSGGTLSAGKSASRSASSSVGGATGGAEAILESKAAAAGGSVAVDSAPVPAPAAGNGSTDDFAAEEAASEEEGGGIAYAASGAMPAPAAANAPAEQPDQDPEEPASPYLTDSLRGSDAGLSAMDEGEFYGVIVFYDALPEGISQKDWAMQTPREGEKARWLVPAEDLKSLLEAGICDEVYFGDRMAGQGLVLLVASEEE